MADEEYTSEQRRVIGDRLRQSVEDVRKGRLHAPFETREELIGFPHRHDRSGQEP
jgi:hypothetical protein